MGTTRAERFVFALAGLVLAVSAVLAVQQRWAERAAEQALAAGLPALAEAAAATAPAAADAQAAGAGAAARAAGDGSLQAAGGAPGGGPGAAASGAVVGGGLPGAPDGPEGAARDALVVHVAGAVQRPGVYRLPPGARVADAVAAAGGAKPQAWLDAINLAAPLADGVQVFVPARGQPLPPPGWPPGAATGAGAGGMAPAGSAVGGAAGSGTAGPLDLNAADARALEALPGIGPSLAARIVEYRARHGPFRRVEDLLAVPGIGPRTLERLRPLVVVR